MKTQLLRGLALATLASGATHAADLTVTVTDIRASKGSILIRVMDSEDAWNNAGKPMAGQKAAATGKEVTFRFTNLPPGQYAVQVMHDENDNSKLDTNLLGIPIEGYGFSNNLNVMRRVRFDEARFALGTENATVVVHLR